MRKYLAILLLIVIATSCFPYNNGEGDALRESRYEPITVNRADFENRIVLQAPQPIVNPGKIYVKDDFLFINEVEKGIHIFDNVDPSNPIPKAFINIDGNTDIAIKESVIYAHHVTDLVAFQYVPRLNIIRIKHRETNVFPVQNSPDGFLPSFFNVPANQIIIGYRLI